MIHVSAKQIIDFWFSPRVRKLWFNSTRAFDGELLTTYIQAYESAFKGELDHWGKTSLDALALIIILDQFPLNMFRNLPRCFESENKALRAARNAVKNKLDIELKNEQKVFIYMPFMHSENLQDQDRSVELYNAAGLHENIKFAKHHREIVAKFGRFPHRNSILGRISTEEEIIYLQSAKAFKG